MESLLERLADYLPALLAALFTSGLFALYMVPRIMIARRELVRKIRFVSEEQYRSASDEEIWAVTEVALERKLEEHAAASLQRIKATHGRDLKVGHLWWLLQQVDGKIPWDAVAPTCGRGGQSLGTHPLSKSLPLSL